MMAYTSARSKSQDRMVDATATINIARNAIRLIDAGKRQGFLPFLPVHGIKGERLISGRYLVKSVVLWDSSEGMP